MMQGQTSGSVTAYVVYTCALVRSDGMGDDSLEWADGPMVLVSPRRLPYLHAVLAVAEQGVPALRVQRLHGSDALVQLGLEAYDTLGHEPNRYNRRRVRLPSDSQPPYGSQAFKNKNRANVFESSAYVFMALFQDGLVSGKASRSIRK